MAGTSNTDNFTFRAGRAGHSRTKGMSMLYSKSQWEIARPMIAARKKFRLRLEKWPDSEAKMKFILRHEMATKAEQSAAGSWLFTHGYRPEDA